MSSKNSLDLALWGFGLADLSLNDRNQWMFRMFRFSPAFVGLPRCVRLCIVSVFNLDGCASATDVLEDIHGCQVQVVCADVYIASSPPSSRGWYNL